MRCLKQTLQALSKENKKVILTRELNINLLNFDKNKEVNEFLDVLTSNWFTPQILGPTRFVEHNKPSLVDNIFVNFSDMYCTSGNIIEKITDHLPNFLLIEGLNTQLDSKVKTLKRDLQHFTPKKLINDFLALNLGEKLERTKDINQKYELFHKNLVEVINQNAPLKPLTKKEAKRQKKPWITKGILTSIGEKNKLLKKFIKTGDQLTYCRYKTYRDNLNHLIRKSKKKHYTQYFFDAKNDMKKMWRQINKIIHKGENKDNINCIKTSHGIENKPHVIGNKFNNYFTTIAQNLVSKIKTAPDFQQFLDPQVQESIFLSPTTKEEVAKHINSLNSKKSSDIYGMSATFLKTLSSSVSETLSTLYNESFSQGIFLDHMKHAMVTPVHKRGSRLDMTNYRPITVLPICSKILEKTHAN